MRLIGVNNRESLGAAMHGQNLLCDYIVEKGFNAGFIAMDLTKAVLDLVATLNSDMFMDTLDDAKP